MNQIRKSEVRRLATALFAAASLSVGLAAQSNAPGERFTATAMDMDRGTTTQLQIVVDRWSSQTQRTKLLDELTKKGPEKLLDALQDQPKVGYIRSSTSLGWDLRYAYKTPGEDGGERVVLVTDRPIAFWETANDSRTLDYPFTVIEIRMPHDGEGQGMLSIAAKIARDKKGDITIENWGTQPIRLTQVRAEGKSAVGTSGNR
jgi:hypothetical protein